MRHALQLAVTGGRKIGIAREFTGGETGSIVAVDWENPPMHRSMILRRHCAQQCPSTFHKRGGFVGPDYKFRKTTTIKITLFSETLMMHEKMWTVYCEMQVQISRSRRETNR